jgi:hypothetical protein
MNDLDALAKLLQALSPWRAHLIFVGGWAHRVHRFDPRANKLQYQPVFTRDTDLAFANRAPIEGDIKGALIAHGFKEQLTGEHKPPVAYYTLGEENGGFYAEFLTPLMGSGVKRGGRARCDHGDGRYISSEDPPPGYPPRSPLDDHAGSLERAATTLGNRRSGSQPGALLQEFNETWKAAIKPALGDKLSNVVVDLSNSTFSSVNDVIRAAARIPQDRKLSPEQLQMVCQLAFEQILRA